MVASAAVPCQPSFLDDLVDFFPPSAADIVPQPHFPENGYNLKPFCYLELFDPSSRRNLFLVFFQKMSIGSDSSITKCFLLRVTQRLGFSSLLWKTILLWKSPLKARTSTPRVVGLSYDDLPLRIFSC